MKTDHIAIGIATFLIFMLMCIGLRACELKLNALSGCIDSTHEILQCKAAYGVE